MYFCVRPGVVGRVMSKFVISEEWKCNVVLTGTPKPSRLAPPSRVDTCAHPTFISRDGLIVRSTYDPPLVAGPSGARYNRLGYYTILYYTILYYTILYYSLSPVLRQLVYIYIYILHIFVYAYIYIYIYREREREIHIHICMYAATCSTADSADWAKLGWVGAFHSQGLLRRAYDLI